MLVAITLSLAWLATPAPPSDPAQLMPADCLMYFGTDSVKAGAEASRNTAMSRILDEAEVRSFLHKPTAAAEVVLNALLEQAAAQMGDLADFPSDVKIDMSPSEGEGLNVGQVFVAFTHLSMPTSPDNPVPDIGLVAGVQLFDAGQLEILKGLWAAFPGEAAQGNYGGVDYAAKMIPDAPVSVHLAFLGDTAVLSLSAEALKGVIDRFQGTAPAGSSLADSADYKSMLKAAGGTISGGTTSFVRVGRLMGVAQQFVGMAAAEAGDPETAQTFASLFASLGLDAVRLAGSTSAVGKDGLIHSTSVMSVDTSAPGLIPGLVKGSGTIDRGMLAHVPGDTLGASLWTMGDELVTVYDFVMNAIGAVEPGEREQIEGMMTAMLGGASLRDDLLGNLHGESMYYSVPGTSFTGAPESVMTTGVRNPEGLVKIVEAVAKAVSEQAGMPVKLKSSEHEGVALYELDLSGTPVAAVLQPAFAIRDGELIFSDQVRRLKSTLNSAPGADDSLAHNAGLSAFLDSLGADAKLQSMKYADNAANFKTQYTQISQFLPMVGPMMGDIPLDFAKLPPEKAVAQHLGPTYAARFTGANDFIVDRSISQFQLSDAVPFLLVGGLVAYGQSEGLDVSAAAVEAVDPEKMAQLDLRELKAACTVYKISTGGYPESLEALLAPLPDYEDGALPRNTLPVDPWGNGYYFALEAPPGKARPKPKLWSAGPNGVNENGEGDDIVKF